MSTKLKITFAVIIASIISVGAVYVGSHFQKELLSAQEKTFLEQKLKKCVTGDETMCTFKGYENAYLKDYVNDNIILKKTAELASGTCKKFEGCYGMNAKAIEALDNIIK